MFCHSPALTASLRQLARMIPELRKDILEGLLKMLSLVLLGRPLQHLGAPKPKAASLPTSMSTQNLQELPDVATITLALRTLGSFDFEGLYCLKLNVIFFLVMHFRHVKLVFSPTSVSSK